MATLDARTVHEQLKAAMADAGALARPPLHLGSPPQQPDLPPSPFAESRLQLQQQGQQSSPPMSPTPAAVELMRSLTLSDMALPGSPASSGGGSAAAAPTAFGITPTCEEALAPLSCSSELASLPPSATCPAGSSGIANGSTAELQLRAVQLRAMLREQAQQAQQARHEQVQRSVPALLLQQQALPPLARASLFCGSAAPGEGGWSGSAISQGGAAAVDASAGWGQQQRLRQCLQPVAAPLPSHAEPQATASPSDIFQHASLSPDTGLSPAASLGAPMASTQLPATDSSFLGAGCNSLPLFQAPEAWGAPQLPLASLAGGYSVQHAQQAQQMALHTASQALLMPQLPAHLQAHALLQYQLQQQQLQSAAAAAADMWQRRLLNARQAQHAQRRQMPGLHASQLAKHAEQDPPETLVGINGRYQPYCQQVIVPLLNEAAACALTAVKLLQAGDTPASQLITGKRFFCSLKEVAKVVPAAKCLIVAPDVRISPTAHINPVAALQRILRSAEACNVPVIFALSRRGIGQVFGRDKSMSIVAIMHLDGLEQQFDMMVREALKGRQLFQQYRGSGTAASHHHTPAPAPAPAFAHHAPTFAPASAGAYAGGPFSAGPFSSAATALLQQGLPSLQPCMPLLG
ncbi:hypothetical protein ABPG75_005105 [Micractinium tetrahymenae]